MSRDELIAFCEESAEQLGETEYVFNSMTNEELKEKADWFDYLLDK